MFSRAAGRRSAGEPCAGPLDCEDGAYCGRVEDDGSCRRECVAYARDGDACEIRFLTETCGPGPVRCIDGTCRATPRSRRAGSNEPCGLLAAGAGYVDERCAPPLTCGGRHEDPQLHCISAELGEGDDCAFLDLPDRLCAAPLSCGPGVWTCHA